MEAVRAIDLLRWALFILGALVIGQATLGFLGFFAGTASVALAAVVVVVVGIQAGRSGLLSMHRTLFAGWQPVETGLLTSIATAIGIFIWIGAGRDAFTYDSISFHLYFPASWMDSGGLEIVPMVFGDVAPAYNPSNVELLIHLLMAPLDSGYLAECAQVPFALIAVLAIYAAARELRASRSAALCGCLAFLLIPEVWTQSTVSMVDLAVGALFLAMIPFLLRLWRAPCLLDAIAASTAWGLFIGTKFVALPYSAPLLIALGAILWRQRDGLRDPRRVVGLGALMIAIVIATGGFWYLRNWFVTGNPIFPLHVDILGSWRLGGLYGSALMREWDYHVPIGNLKVLGEMLLGAGVAFVVSGIAALLIRWRGPELPLAMIQLATFWLWIPYQHSRFLFGFFGVVAVAQAVATREPRVGKACWIFLIGAITGSLIQWPSAEKFVVIGVGLAGAALPLLERRIPLRVPALAAALAFALVIASGLGSYRERYPGYTYGPEFQGAWQWVHENVSNSHIAYTGSNLPFPLYGKNLSNRVSYANVAMGPNAKVHEFPVDEPATTPEPTPYRKGANFETWLANLRAIRCDTLFVTTMFPIVLRGVDHDDDGFPAERAWADEHPEIFRLRYSTEEIRIYDVN